MRKANLPSTFLVPLLAALVMPGVALAQFQSARYAATDAERADLTAGRDRLRHVVDALRAAVKDEDGAASVDDVQIYLDALDRDLRQGLFFTAKDIPLARAVLAEGEGRAASLSRGVAPWRNATGVVTLGHRSAVDGSVQPFQVYVPAGYSFASPSPMRLDIFLHGRGGTLSELQFLGSKSWVKGNFGTAELPYLALYPYGRGNNGWRFAGERDLYEALAEVKRRYRVEENLVMLRGFSMGGHGCWHIGLQHPGDWAVMAPGAGFVDTRNYQEIKQPLPVWQDQLLHMYDPVDYAANAKNLPVLAYTGELDPAISQHELMVKRLNEEGAPYKEFRGPDTPHRYEPKSLEAILQETARYRRHPDARRVDFVTYTLRWPECKWIRIEGQERGWTRTEVHAHSVAANRIEIRTENVTAFKVTLPFGLLAEPAELGQGAGKLELVVDGKPVTGATVRTDQTLSLVRTGKSWSVGSLKGQRKKPGLEGPIDDALFGPVLAVRGTGAPWSVPLDAWSRQELGRFRDGWGEFFRATLPETTDVALTREQIRSHNLYLFGDPGSNQVLRRILPGLPLEWEPGRITVRGQSYSTADHVPMLVFPNPENPERYVVIDCGFSFGRADWRGSNALQYPHLPDYAVVKFDADNFSDDFRANAEVAGFFDERWRMPAKSNRH